MCTRSSWYKGTGILTAVSDSNINLINSVSVYGVIDTVS